MSLTTGQTKKEDSQSSKLVVSAATVDLKQTESAKVVQHSSDSVRLALIEAQYTLKETRDKPRGRGVLILMSGIELAGKGEALMQLREWADPRLFNVKARLPVEPHSPAWLRDASLLPEKGEIVILFGNWYGDLLKAHMAYLQDKKGSNKKNKNDDAPKMTGARFQREIEHLLAFENDLRAQGITVCKCWFDLSWNHLQKRLDEVSKSDRKWLHLHGLDWRNKDQYQTLQKLRKDMGSDWIEIDCENEEARDLKFGHVVLNALTEPRLPIAPAARRWQRAEVPASLYAPANTSMEKESYKSRINASQKKLEKLVQRCGERSIVLVFEGMDAAGKGGVISRIVAPHDTRQNKVFTIAAPELHELRHPYLWRFWSKLPEMLQTAANMTIFDR
ncbi:MAG: hypothetical protein NVSMB40_09600 [Aquirhabdus sp.]